MTFLYELINFLVVFSILYIVLIYLKLDFLKSSLLILHLVAIFLLNDVLFPASYMGDQFRYVDATQAIRKGGDLALTTGAGFSGSIFALTPIPFINSVRSIAMANFLIFLFMFTFLKKKKLSSNSVDFFILLYPSLLLYSSLALRDTLVFLFMFMIIYFYLIERNYLLCIILSVPLIALKFQNILIYGLSIIVFYIIKGGFRFNKIIFIVISLFIFNFLLDVRIERFSLREIFSISNLEGMRYALFSENYGYDYLLVAKLGYNPVESIPEFILVTIKGLFRFLFGPFIWSFDNIFQFIQSLENIVIIILIIGINFSRKYFIETREKILFLNLMILTAFSIYGFVVFNLGSSARYKFAFIGVYIIISFYLIKRDHLLAKTLHINKENPMNVLDV